MTVARAWIRAARPLAHANVAPPLAFGEALGFAVTGHLDPIAMALVHVFGVADHLTIVFANDYADRDADALNTTFNVYSGGSRVLPDGALSARAVARAALLAALATLALGAALAARAGRAYPAALAVAAVVLLHAYSYAPARLSYRGGGEVLQGLGLGVVLPCVGFAASGAPLAALPWPALLPGVLLGIAGNLTTAMPDAPADARAGKRTLVVALGPRRAAWLASGLVAAGAVLALAALPVRWSATAAALTVGAPLALAAWNALGPPPRAEDRRACFAWVTRGGGAIGWSIAAWTCVLAASRYW